MISIESEKSEEDIVDRDEFMWETLPGRCCFTQTVDDCDMCTVWSDPENFCHSSQENCELCGAHMERHSLSPHIAHTEHMSVRFSFPKLLLDKLELS